MLGRLWKKNFLPVGVVMGRTIVFLLLFMFSLLSGSHFLISQELPAFNYRDSRLSGLGGLTVFAARGVEALHTNPASISRSDDVEYTLVKFTPWLTMNPQYIPSIFNSGLDDDALLKAGETGYGEGFNFLTGITGKGVGIGILNGIQTIQRGGDSSLDGYISADLSLVVGYAVGISPGNWDFCLAGDVRPLARVFGTYTQQTALDAGRQLVAPLKLYELLGSVENPYYASGFAFDLGGTAAWKGLSLGAVIRDIGGTKLSGVTAADVDEAMARLYGISAVTSGTEDAVVLTTPMKINAGIRYGFNSESIPGWKPVLYLEVQDITADMTISGLLDNGIVGFDMGLPGPVSLLAGVNAGGLSLGADLKLPILGLGLSWFSDVSGSSGIALEGRVQF